MQGPARTDRTHRRALVALAIRVASAALAYGSQILWARWLGLEGFGTFMAVWVWLLVAGGTAPLGLNVLVIGLLPGLRDDRDDEHWRGLALLAAATALATGLAGAALGWLLLAATPHVVPSPYLAPVWLGLACLPLIALADVNEGIARAHGWLGHALTPAYILRPIVMLATAAAWRAAGHSLDPAGVMVCAIIACFVTAVPQSLMLIARMQAMAPGRAVAVRPRAWLVAALPVLVTEILELVVQNLDFLLIAGLLGSEAAGLYFAGLKTIALVAFINFAVGAASANEIALAGARGDRNVLERQIRAAVTLAFWPTLGLALIIVALSPWLMQLFGPDFAAAGAFVPVLAIGLVARAMVGPAELYFNVLGEQRACALLLTGAVLVGVVLQLALISAHGLAGGAWASAATLVLLSVGFHLLARWRLGLTLAPHVPWRLLPSEGVNPQG